MNATVVVGIAALSGAMVVSAAASPLSDALARAKPADVEKLRAQRKDPPARCTLGAIYAKRGDLPRASLYLGGCDSIELPPEIGVEIRKHLRETRKKINEAELAQLELASKPEGMTVETTALPGEPIVTPATIYVKPGTYEVRSTEQGTLFKVTVVTQANSRAVAYLDTGVKPKDPAQKDQKMDFSEDGGVTQNAGPPPDVKRPSLMPDRYKGKASGGGPQLDDPLAAGRASAPRPARPWSIGARLGGGMFDDATASARPGLAIAATGRFVLGERLFAAGRLDWSRRGGGDAMNVAIDSVDVAGLSAGAGVRVVGPVAALAQLRGDLRLASSRAENMPVKRAGASVAVGVEVDLPSTPLVAGLRFEQGVTELATGARDRAVLLEIGIDWR